jgi:predicted Zn-dependent protease with MMP-like domain
VFEVDRESFVELVLRALDGLPEEFRERIANLDVAVEDVARLDDYARTRTSRRSTLLGVYRGVPLTRRGAHYNMTLPDTIVIFQQPIQRLARDEDDLERRVRHVVQHEVAHYFGISDDRLREIDAY